MRSWQRLSKSAGKSFSIDKDDVTGKAYDARLMRRLIKYLKPYTLQVIVAITLLLLIAGSRLVGPYLTKIAIDRYIMTGNSEGLITISIIF